MAAFDFDGTLTSGGSVFPFLVQLKGRGPVLRATGVLAPQLGRAALMGGVAADGTKQKMFTRLFAGMSESELNNVAASFASDHLAKHLRDDMRRRLEWHQNQGHYTMIVSASPECYVRPAGELLGVDGVVATRLAVDSKGFLTGGYDGKNCRGAEKFSRLIAHLRSSGLFGTGAEQPEMWAYGNSRGDLRMLQAADHGVDAGRLGPLGRLRRFPRLVDVVAESGQGVAAMPTTSPE